MYIYIYIFIMIHNLWHVINVICGYFGGEGESYLVVPVIPRDTVALNNARPIVSCVAVHLFRFPVKDAGLTAKLSLHTSC